MPEKHGNGEMFYVLRGTSREEKRVTMLEEEGKYKRSKQAGKEKVARGAQGRRHKKSS